MAESLLLAGFLIAAPACAPSGERAGSDGSRAAASAAGPLDVSDLEAYRVGMERELRLARAASDALRRALGAEERTVLAGGADSSHTIAEGAFAAEVSVDRYRHVVRVVDSLLRNRLASDSVPPASGVLTAAAAALFRHSAPRLDSLRVALVVLRSRLAAGRAGTCGGGGAGRQGSPC